jgi:hypothetical protein
MKQIFILEREELNELKRGEALKIVFGDQIITLQADVPRRPSGLELRAPSRNGRRGPSKGVTITARVAEYLETKGPASALEIAKALGVSPSSVSSPLIRGRGSLYKRTGKSRNAVWRAL